MSKGYATSFSPPCKLAPSTNGLRSIQEMMAFVSVASCGSRKQRGVWMPVLYVEMQKWLSLWWHGEKAYRAIKEVFWEGDVMIGHETRDPSSVLSSPQDAVEVWEVLKDVVTLFSPVTQCPVPHLWALEGMKDDHVRAPRFKALYSPISLLAAEENNVDLLAQVLGNPWCWHSCGCPAPPFLFVTVTVWLYCPPNTTKTSRTTQGTWHLKMPQIQSWLSNICA